MKALADDEEFSAKLVSQIKERTDHIAKLTEDGQREQLEVENRGYEARVFALSAQADRDIQTVKDKRQKQLAEIDKEQAALKPKADAGDEQAKARMKALDEQALKVDDTRAEERAIREKARIDASIARITLLKDAREKNLGAQAALGDQAAAVELAALQRTKELQTTEAALTAVMRDQNATAEQRTQAQRALNDAKAAAAGVSTKEVGDGKEFILQQQAALGNKAAEVELKRLEITKTFRTEKEKLLGVLKDENATAADKKSAAAELTKLDTLQKQALAKAAGAQAAVSGPQLNESRFLSGIGAASREKDMTQKLVDNGKELLVTTNKLLGVMQGVQQNTTKNNGHRAELK
jgi:hypothetical protein